MLLLNDNFYGFPISKISETRDERTDRQRDRQTDRQTDGATVTLNAVASYGWLQISQYLKQGPK